MELSFSLPGREELSRLDNKKWEQFHALVEDINRERFPERYSYDVYVDDGNFTYFISCLSGTLRIKDIKRIFSKHQFNNGSLMQNGPPSDSVYRNAQKEVLNDEDLMVEHTSTRTVYFYASCK